MMLNCISHHPSAVINVNDLVIQQWCVELRRDVANVVENTSTKIVTKITNGVVTVGVNTVQLTRDVRSVSEPKRYKELKSPKVLATQRL